MSLSESLQESPPPPHRPDVVSAYRPLAPDDSDKLRSALTDVFALDSVQQSRHPRGNRLIVFRGKLLGDSEATYSSVAERFRTLGYTTMMERKGQWDMIYAVEGVIGVRMGRSRPWLHIVLLVATIITTILAGAAFQGRTWDVIQREVIRRGNVAYIGRVVQSGAPFALTLLLILGVHEMGHYLAARRHGVSVSLPFFIPLPFLNPLGTLGAVIFIRSPLTSRKQLYDVGISGPLAGFVVALVAFIISLYLRPASQFNQTFYLLFGSDNLGMPLLLTWLGDWFRPDIRNLGNFVANQPIAFAAWFGMLLTALNLLPMGQLDGGHIMYALFGRASWTIAYIAIGLMFVLGVMGFPSLIFYALLVLLTGLRHPPPNDDITPLDWQRRALGYATLVLFFLIATPTPFPGRGF
jgi:membrane-associated protease RseP (regulator of RpoE activity)